MPASATAGSYDVVVNGSNGSATSTQGYTYEIECHVDNCSNCSAPNQCNTCEAGYHLTSDNKCELDCGVDNCQTCSAPNVCQTCNTGYNLTNSNTCIQCTGATVWNPTTKVCSLDRKNVV